jgi:tripartite-type tricarboxylate transporter receptor subunit TctC
MVRLCAFALVLMTVDGACAQSWPSRPIRAIVPYTAGGAIDIVSRTVAQQLSLQLGYPIVIESRPGAGGVIGTAAVAKADPDGHTILLTASSHTISPWAYSNLPYDTVADLAGITPLANLPNVLVVAPSANIRSAQALVAAARAKAGGLNYASGGSGSATHLNAERFRLSAGFEGVHVPFKGGPEALAEVMSGRVDFVFSPILPSLPFIRDGKAVALGEHVEARIRAARRADDARGRLREFRLQFLGRHIRAGENLPRYRRKAPSRDRQGAAVAGNSNKALELRRGPDAHAAIRVRRLCSQRDRRQRDAGESRRPRSEVTASSNGCKEQGERRCRHDAKGHRSVGTPPP